jgi:hypothetical protein
MAGKFSRSNKTAMGRGATVIVMDTVTAACSVPVSGRGGAARGVDGSGSMRQLQRLVTVVLATAVFAAAGCTAAPVRERVNEAWSQRLTQQSESIQARADRQERSQVAWSARLSEQAHAYLAEQVRVQRANGAWSLRLAKLADHVAGGDTSMDRASQAWSDRLNGLAGSGGVVD